MNWKLAEALLAQQFPSLKRGVAQVIPPGYVFQLGIDQDPPRIILLIGKEYQYGRTHPLLGLIKQTLLDDDLQPLYKPIADVLKHYPRLSSACKIAQGVLAYKLWIER